MLCRDRSVIGAVFLWVSAGWTGGEPGSRPPRRMAFADAAARIRNRRTAATSANKQTRPDADGLANEQSGVVDQTANDTVFVP